MATTTRMTVTVVTKIIIIIIVVTVIIIIIIFLVFILCNPFSRHLNFFDIVRHDDEKELAKRYGMVRTLN